MIYKIIVDKQSRTNPSSEKKEYTIDIEELRVKGEIYDSLVIKKDETYVMRRLSLSELHVLSVLEEPIKEPLGDLNVELFEGDNYIYLLDMIGNKFYAEYIVKNEFTEMYVTNAEMNSAITQTAQEIDLSVNQKLTSYSTIKELTQVKDEAINTSDTNTDNKLKDYSTTIEMNSAINLKADEIQSSVSKTYTTKEETTTAKQEAIDSANSSTDDKLDNYSTTVEMNSAITQKANEINLELEGKVDEEKFTGANIMLAINNDSSSATINADKISLNGKKINLTSEDIVIESDSFNVDKNGRVSIIDNTGTTGELNIYTEGTNYKTEVRSFGQFFNGPNGYVGIEADFAMSGGTIKVSPSQEDWSNCTFIQNGSIECVTLKQTSLANQKKNFEKLKSGLDILKDIDIYKYNLKSEEDTTKKHIGFVIGDNYNYSEEVTSNNNDGVDIYSFVAVCCKAIQEQQEQIENQNNLIKSLTERIEKLEAK